MTRGEKEPKTAEEFNKQKIRIGDDLKRRNIESERARAGTRCLNCAHKFKHGELCAYYYTPDKYAMDDFVCMPCAAKLPTFKGDYGVKEKEGNR